MYTGLGTPVVFVATRCSYQRSISSAVTDSSKRSPRNGSTCRRSRARWSRKVLGAHLRSPASSQRSDQAATVSTRRFASAKRAFSSRDSSMGLSHARASIRSSTRASSRTAVLRVANLPAEYRRPSGPVYRARYRPVDSSVMLPNDRADIMCSFPLVLRRSASGPKETNNNRTTLA